MNEQLLDYIKKARGMHMSDVEIRHNLSVAGWQDADVEAAFHQIDASAAVQPGATAPAQPSASQPAPKEVPGTSIHSEAMQTAQPMPVTDPSSGLEPMTVKKSGWKKIVLPIAIVVIVLLAAFFAYAAFFGPSRVWAQFAKNLNTAAVPALSHVDGQFGFKDKYQSQDINVSLHMVSDEDATDQNSVKSSSKFSLNYNFGSVNAGINNIQALTVGDNTYVDVSQIPFASDLAKDYNGWVKIDTKSIHDTGNNKQLEELLKTFDYSKLVKSHKYVGAEVIDGTSAYHYSLDIDKDYAKEIFNKVFDQEHASSNNSSQFSGLDNPQDTKNTVSKFIDQMNFDKFDLWLGVKDHLLHKVDISLSMPSVVETAQGGSKTKAVDAKSLADARQVSTALQLYYDDNQGYPASINSLVPMYISAVPTFPADDSRCTGSDANYSYQTSGNSFVRLGKTLYPSYQFKFCLGEATGGYAAGIVAATPQGIQNIGPATSPLKPDVVSTAKSQLTLTATISAAKQPVNVSAPAKYYDMTKDLGGLNSASGSGGAYGSRDNQRLADVKQLATALELYYNDHGGYPKSLNDIFPTYIALMPSAPVPADGACTDADNAYTYKASGIAYTGTGTPAVQVYPTYTLNFCLGSQTSGYAAGKHLASPASIQ